MTDTALGEVAEAAERVADDQRHVARQARSMQRQRDSGRSWSDILAGQPDPGIFERLRRSRHLLRSAATTFSRSVVAELSREGSTRRQIARLIGVSHQRVTALLDGRDHHE